MAARRRPLDLERLARARKALDELVASHPELTRPAAAERLAHALEEALEDAEAEGEDLEAILERAITKLPRR